MKRRSNSYLLLLVFLSLVFHDMIPHHEEFVFDSDGYDHILTHCSSEELVLSSTESCNFHVEEEAGHHDSCPPHFHKCTVNEFDVNRNSRQLSSSTDATGDVMAVHTETIILHDIESTRGLNSTLLNSPIFKRHHLGSIFLRAPPVTS